MSTLEKRAWLTLWSMSPPYLIYFFVQGAFPNLLPTMLDRIVCLAVVAGFHAVSYLTGWLIIRRGDRGEALVEDERDRVIDARATRAAYFLLLTGILVVGVVMPFGESGWQIINAALAFVVSSETLRHGLIVMGYRRPRLAH